MTKKVSLFLCIVVLALALVGCGGEGPANSTENSGDGTVTTDAPGKTVPVEKNEFVPNGKKYDSEDFSVLCSGNSIRAKIDFEYAEENQTILDNAIFNRNQEIEALYDIKISYVQDTGSKNEGAEKIRADYTSGEANYDLSYIGTYSVIGLAGSDMLYDLNSVPGIDTSKSYWDQNANEDLAINGKLFYSTGDISIADDVLQFAISFNKEAMKKQAPDVNLYQLVEEGKWTFDKLFETSKGFYEEIDGDDTFTLKDKIGLCVWDDTIYAALNSSGERIAAYNKNEKTFEVGILSSERALNVLDFWALAQNNEGVLNRQRFNQMDGTEATNAFVEGRVLFNTPLMCDLDGLRNMDTDYGILPYPKFDENQTRYYTSTSAFHMSYVCTVNCDDRIDMRGEIIEALAYYGQKYLKPAYEEKTLRGAYVRDEESLISLDIMAKTRIYDIGFMVKPANLHEKIIIFYRDKNTAFASLLASSRSASEATIKQLIEDFQFALE